MIILCAATFFTCLLPTHESQILRSSSDANKIPDDSKLTVDFVMKYGYPGEMHEVTTKDNYILTLHRIPHNGTNQQSNRPVVLLQHGIVLSSDQWVLRGTQDVVFLLSQQGYDVWMSNTRGTSYSKHKKYSINDYKFWNYSLDELGNQDLPAIIDYVLNVTNKSYLTYVGHSRGVAMAVILLSSQPEYNAKINLLVGIAPVIYSKEAKCIIYEMAGNRPNALMKVSTLQDIFEKAEVKNVLSTTNSTRFMINTVCKRNRIMENLCLLMSFFINGEDFEMFNKSMIPTMVSHFTLGVGAKELIHLLQISESDVFRPFDYGKQLNIKHYGTETPKPYDLAKITVPVYLYYGPNDFFVSERVMDSTPLMMPPAQEVAKRLGKTNLLTRLYSQNLDTNNYLTCLNLCHNVPDLFKFAKQLSNFQGAYKIPFSKFNHIDYIFANNANQLFFPHLIKLINIYNKSQRYN